MDELKRLMTDEDYHSLKALSLELKESREKLWIPFKNNLHKHIRLTSEAITRIDARIAKIVKLTGEK